MASAVANLRSAGGGNVRFNEEALAWDTKPFVQEASRDAKREILGKFSKLQWRPKTVLEIGCGTGILSFLIANHVDQVVAVDAAEGMIDVLKRKLLQEGAPVNVKPLCLLLEDPEDSGLPPADQSDPNGERQKFDLITSHLVLHHIPDLEPVLSTMFGCLAAGGRTMLTDFQDFGPEAKRFHAASKMAGVARHGINVEEMTELMHKVGFVNVECRPEWTMTKTIEKFDGEFGNAGKPGEGQGEKLDFPFLICYGEKPS